MIFPENATSFEKDFGNFLYVRKSSLKKLSKNPFDFLRFLSNYIDDVCEFSVVNYAENPLVFHAEIAKSMCDFMDRNDDTREIIIDMMRNKAKCRIFPDLMRAAVSIDFFNLVLGTVEGFQFKIFIELLQQRIKHVSFTQENYDVMKIEYDRYFNLFVGLICEGQYSDEIYGNIIEFLKRNSMSMDILLFYEKLAESQIINGEIAENLVRHLLQIYISEEEHKWAKIHVRSLLQKTELYPPKVIEIIHQTLLDGSVPSLILTELLPRIPKRNASNIMKMISVEEKNPGMVRCNLPKLVPY